MVVYCVSATATQVTVVECRQSSVIGLSYHVIVFFVYNNGGRGEEEVGGEEKEGKAHIDRNANFLFQALTRSETM